MELSYESVVQEAPNERSKARSLLARTAFASGMTVNLIFAGCGDDNDIPERNSPATAPYSLENNFDYRDNLRRVLNYTEDPTSRENVNNLIHMPIAEWLTQSLEKTQKTIRENITQSITTDSIPMFVAYNIPKRDLGGESRGGLPGADVYKDWVHGISDAIGDNAAVIILEPDALAHADDMDGAEKINRLGLISYALEVFQDNSHTAVYLDIGNSRWLSPQAAAELLHQVSPNKPIPGISLNVANRRSEAETREYAQQIEEAYGHELYVMIDNSLNGAPDTAEITEWCNPEGQKIGTLNDVAFDRDAKVEAAFIKVPGRSDGRCGTSDAPAGEFDGRLLLDQVSE